MVEPWWRPDEASRDVLTAELIAELSPGHPLFGLTLEVQNQCGACDVVQSVSLPVTASMWATDPHVSIGAGCTRG